jgi:N utilization substance protein B
VGSYHQARQSAICILYESYIKEISPLLILQEVKADEDTKKFIKAVVTHISEIDTVLKEQAIHWNLDRIIPIDRAIMSLALAEYYDAEINTPPGVILSEAVMLADKYSTKDSPKFVNGLLASVIKRET